MLDGNRQNAVEATRLMPDPRVTHFWNDQFIAGDYFRDFHFGHTAWDIYFLYGPEAVWHGRPEPLSSYGYMVYAQRRQLADDLTRIVTPSP